MKVICTRNDSKTLPYFPGVKYSADDIGGGMFKISVPNGSHIIAPLKGYYLEFLQVD